MSREQALGKMLKAKGLSIAVAESITGGLVGDLITNEPGASQYFEGGVITYSNRSKNELLGVKEETLASHGAVSEQCAKEMAQGVRQRFHASIGLSITGIAGPTGATPGKPIGLVCFGIDDGDVVRTERVIFSGDRVEIKRAAAQHALQMTLDLLAVR